MQFVRCMMITTSSKNLKDILLNLDEPTYTPFLQNIKFSKDTLNSSQKEAIRKALYSDSISLIQGLQGTGKTTVIKENCAANFDANK